MAVQIIRTRAELDEKIAECNRAEAVSDDAMRAVFDTFRMDPPTDLPPDPFGPDYLARQMQLYEEIAGKAYSTDCEATRLDVEAAVRSPFPFFTQSCRTAGEYFMAMGLVLKAMALPPRSSVLEFGPGWGHIALWLAQLGHRVTVVDVEPSFCELIRRRAAQVGVEIEIVNSDFFWVEGVDRSFDAILFLDCFHHCADHLRLLASLRRVVAKDGRVFFREPIVPDFPLPWGLRLDGCALWGIRKNGWMELGFRDEYFRRALVRTGWFPRKASSPDMDQLRVWIASHREGAIFRFAASDPRLQTQVGTRRDDAIVLTRCRAGAGLYGPYIDLPAGQYVASLRFRPSPPAQGRAVMDVCAETGGRCLASRPVKGADLQAAAMVATLAFEAPDDLREVEVRLVCEQGFSGEIEGVEIVFAG